MYHKYHNHVFLTTLGSIRKIILCSHLCLTYQYLAAMHVTSFVYISSSV